MRAWADHARHLFVILHDRRDEVRSALQADGITAGVHYPIPAHRQPAMASVDARTLGRLEVTDRLSNTCLSLPLYPELPLEEVERISRLVLAV